MKRRVLVQVDEGTHVAWKARAFSEGRSMSELARDLIERAVLTDGVGTNGRAAVGEERGSSEADVTPMLGSAPTPSVSADVAAKVPGVTVGVRAHMRGDRHTLECSERVPAGQVCAKCGRHV